MNDRTTSSLLIALAYALALILTLIACSAPGSASSQPPSGGGISSGQAGGPPSPENAEAQSPVSQAQAQGSAMAKAYREALEGIYNDHLYPNGDPVDAFQMENNDFAIFDVDGDGTKELIYQNDDAIMAGMATTVYSFAPETGKLYQQLSGFVGMTFYDNGVIRVDASHNHGLSARDDFWPYTLYQYDVGGDGYLMAGSVDAWDKATFPADHEGSPFPDDTDQDGDGMIYLLTFGGQEVTATVLDGPDYQQWLNTYLEDAVELDIPWQAMTLENIQAVTAPSFPF